MKSKFFLLFITLAFFACKKNNNIDISEAAEETIKIALLENLNGAWHFLNSTQNGNSDNLPIRIDGEIWKINGDDLNVVRKSTTNYTDLSSGKHKISVVENNNGLVFLLIDEKAFGSINLSETKLSLNTGNLPNESTSHATTYSFKKE